MSEQWGNDKHLMKSSLSSVWRYINTFNYISLQTIKHLVKGCWQNARYCFDLIFVHLISALICNLLWGQSLHLLTDETPATQSRETLLFNYTLTGERSDTNTVTAGSAEPISLIERLQVMTERVIMNGFIHSVLVENLSVNADIMIWVTNSRPWINHHYPLKQSYQEE